MVYDESFSGSYCFPIYLLLALLLAKIKNKNKKRHATKFDEIKNKTCTSKIMSFRSSNRKRRVKLANRTALEAIWILPRKAGILG